MLCITVQLEGQLEGHEVCHGRSRTGAVSASKRYKVFNADDRTKQLHGEADRTVKHMCG